MQRLALSLLTASVMLIGGSAGSQAQRPGDTPPAAEAPPPSQQQPGRAEPGQRPAPLPQVPGVTVPAPPEADNPHGGGGCRYQQRPLELIV